jgi:ABC-2 type transport system ATP-binding protein
MVGMMVDGRLITVDTPLGLRRKALGGEVIILRSLEVINYQTVQDVQKLAFVKKAERHRENEVYITVDNAPEAIPDLVEWSKNYGITVESIHEFLPAYDDVFVALIKKESQDA